MSETTQMKWAVMYQGATPEDRYTYRAILCDMSWDFEKVPTNAVEFSEWLTGMLNQIPEEHRGNAVLILRDSDCDECSSERAKFYLYVDREETDEEYKARRDATKERRERDAEKRSADMIRKAKEKEERDRARVSAPQEEIRVMRSTSKGIL